MTKRLPGPTVIESMTPARKLARLILQRLQTAEAEFLNQGVRDERQKAIRRRESVARVLLAEAGITEASAVELVAVALPRVVAGIDPTDRELGELARFIETNLKRYLEST